MEASLLDIVINVLIAFSLLILTVIACLIAGNFFPVLSQASRTLNAYEKLAETLDSEIKPTLEEFKDVLHGVNELRSITAQRVSDVSTTVEDVAGSMTQAAGQAGKQGSVLGAGFLAGVKAYFSQQKEESEKHDKNYKAIAEK